MNLSQPFNRKPSINRNALVVGGIKGLCHAGLLKALEEQE
jgi:predicted acylesterase/phospholipase RssA